jgi:hypothetical protein
VQPNDVVEMENGERVPDGAGEPLRRVSVVPIDLRLDDQVHVKGALRRPPSHAFDRDLKSPFIL